MKIRTFPEDFIVEEYLSIDAKSDGKYALFKFKKKGWSTFDLISSISTRFKIPAKEISIAGIKDRHAVTTSYLTIKKELASKIIEISKNDEKIISNIDIEFIGFTDNQIRSENIKYNKFSIVARSIDEKDIPLILKRIEIVKNQGVPNYFDDQRFGSARHHEGFVAKSLIQRDFINATKLLFMTSKYDKKNEKISKNEAIKFLFNDSSNDSNINLEDIIKKLPNELKKFFKVILIKKSSLENKNYSNIPKNYKEDIDEINRIYFNAFKSMDRRYLILLFHAYQSYLFNMLLSKLLIELNKGKKFYSLSGEVQQYFFPEILDKDIFELLTNLYLPIPSYNISENLNIKDYFTFKKDNFNIQLLINKILSEIEDFEKIKIGDLKADFLKIKLNNEKRRTLTLAKEIKIYDFENDDFFKGRKKLKLDFILEKGSYATMIIKGIFLQSKFGKAKEVLF